MRIYKNRWFVKFANKEGIGDEKLCQTVSDVMDGKIDADYGSGVIKQRIARPNQGKSGGFRTILFFRRKERAVFVFGFAKKDKENLDQNEVEQYRKAAAIILMYSDQAFEELVKAAVFAEVHCHDEKA